MAKTRSQARTITIKKEEEDHKDTQILHSVNNTAGNNSKITKQISSTSKSSALPAQEIKVEEDIDVKSLLRTSSIPLMPVKAQYISQEQIEQLIYYIVNDKMVVSTAASKLKINFKTASYYYNIYKNDPEKKIPVPLKKLDDKHICTQEQITTLIKHIVDDGMTIREASVLAGMHRKTGRGYYLKYMEDPNRNIPVQVTQNAKQDQIKKLISYIVDDKMSIVAASKKANMGRTTGKKYYLKYLEDPNHDVPVANPYRSFGSNYTQDQVNTLISSIVDDKMTVVDAAKKINMTKGVAKRYYSKYMKDPNHRIPVIGYKNYVSPRTIHQDRIKALIRYITEDGMSLSAASEKAKMTYKTGLKYYQKYLNDSSSISTTPSQSAVTPCYTQEQIKELIRFIVDDKMTIKDASEKANMGLESGEKYYQQYLSGPPRDIPTQSAVTPCYTQEQIKELIRFIVDDKMAVKDAAEKANMSPEADEKYYQQYLSGLPRNIPTHRITRPRCTEEQISTLFRCIIDDEMTLRAASEKANMGYEAGIEYLEECKKYLQKKYVNEPNSKTPTPNHELQIYQYIPEQINTVNHRTTDDTMTTLTASRGATMSANTGHQYVHYPNTEASTQIGRYPNCTQQQVTDLFRYITEDKMSVEDASKKANMSATTGYIYYTKFMESPYPIPSI